jgi:hypothetical protein
MPYLENVREKEKGTLKMAIKYAANGKIVPKRFSMARIENAMRDMAGFCLACGAEREGCEPDARKYPCECCGKNLVFGAEEIALMGYVKG